MINAAEVSSQPRSCLCARCWRNAATVLRPETGAYRSGWAKEHRQVVGPWVLNV